jgi:hypothetical protein
MRVSCQIEKGITLVALLLVLSPRGVQAQHNATMYFMRDLPAVNMLNPAFQPEAGSYYIGIPLLSSIYFDGGITLSGVNIGNLLSSTPRLTSAAANPAPYEGGYANADVNLLNIGVLVYDMYFTLDITGKASAEAAVSGELIKVAWYGNAPYIGKTIPLNGLGGYASAYTEIALGFSKEVVRDKITVGGKIKRLLGVGFADASMGASAFLQTNDDWSTTVRATPEFNVGGVFEATPSSISSYKFGGKGWGADLGFEIKNELFIVSGSIVNIGAIRWNNVNHKKLESGAYDVTFRGIQLNSSSNLTDFIDSMKAEKFVSNAESILRWTTPTLTVGVAYPINEHLVAGTLAGIAIGRYNTYPLFALSLNTWKYPLNGSVSYSYGHSHNLGLGLLFGRRNVQLHAICDNILAASYQKAQKINFRFGLNLLLGGPKQTERRKVWAPLNTIDHPSNTYKETGKPGVLNPLSSPVQPPTRKQPLNPLGSSNVKFVDDESL